MITGYFILAQGLNRIYPKVNIELAEKLLEYSGVLLSEYSVGDNLSKNSFVQRNRIQAGLSNCIVVVETDVKRGTMHTVGFAEKNKRIVACLDHPEKY